MEVHRVPGIGARGERSPERAQAKSCHCGLLLSGAAPPDAETVAIEPYDRLASTL
jgi:hypothetical protein